MARASVSHTLEMKNPKLIPARPWRRVMTASQTTGPLQGMLKTRRMKVRVMAVWMIMTPHWVMMWLARISLGLTPATRDLSSRPVDLSVMKA